MAANRVEGAAGAAGSAPRPGTFRIGELAELAHTTPRTVRYYEEIGLLSDGHVPGRHRVYTDSDVERLRELSRLRDLLGLSLAELRALVEGPDARAIVSGPLHQPDDPAERARLLRDALGRLNTELELVRRRAGDLERLERELVATRRRVKARIRDLERHA